MKVISRDYKCTSFLYKGDFNPKEKMLTQQKLGLRLNNQTPIVFEISFGLYAEAMNEASFEFELTSKINLDLLGKKADAEEIYYVLLNALQNIYKCLLIEVGRVKKNVIPQKPEFDKSELMSLIQSEIDELMI